MATTPSTIYKYDTSVTPKRVLYVCRTDPANVKLTMNPVWSITKVIYDSAGNPVQGQYPNGDDAFVYAVDGCESLTYAPGYNFVANPLTGNRDMVNLDPAAESNTFLAKDFGAVGDGVTDDSAAINAAATAANAAGGGTVYFDAKTYAIASPIVPLSGVVFQGITPIVSYTTANVPDSGFTLTGGTIIKGTSSIDGFAANTTAKANLQANVSAASNASPIVITTAAANGFATGDSVKIASVTGNTAANGTFTVTVTDSTHFSLNGTTGNGSYVSGGTVITQSFNGDAIQQAGIVNIGITGCRNGINVGAMNNIGYVYSKLNNVWVTGCSNFGIMLTNFLHINVGVIRTNANGTNGVGGGGQFYAQMADNAVLECGNSYFLDIYNYSLASKNTQNIVFYATGSFGAGDLNSITVEKLQANNFNTGTIISQTATFNGTSTVAVTDGTKFVVGQPVQFTTSAGGLTAYQAYFVQSVSGNNLTIGTNRYSGTVTPTAATPTIVSDGFSNLELIATETPSTNAIIQFKVSYADLEGTSSGGAVSMENASTSKVSFFTAVNNANESVLVMRKSQNNWIEQFGAGTSGQLDIDSASTQSYYQGVIKNLIQKGLTGFARSTVRGTSGISISGNNSATQVFDIERRAPNGGFILAAIGGMWGDHYTFNTNQGSVGTPYAVNPGVGNVVVATQNTGAAYWQLPTIVNDSSPISAILGMRTLIIPEKQAMNLLTDGTQTFNGIAGCTTAYIPVGASARITAVIDAAAGTMFWEIELFNGASLGGIPTVAAGAAAASASISGTNKTGTITMAGQTVGTSGALCTVSFVGTPFASTPKVILTATSAGASSCQPYVSAVSTSSFTITANASTPSSGAAVNYAYEVLA